MATSKPDQPEEYEVTKLAGPRVAGQIVGGRKTLTLTPAEADYELREGTIVKATPKPAPDAGSGKG